jgi:hypothetical protein
MDQVVSRIPLVLTSAITLFFFAQLKFQLGGNSVSAKV